MDDVGPVGQSINPPRQAPWLPRYLLTSPGPRRAVRIADSATCSRDVGAFVKAAK